MSSTQSFSLLRARYLGCLAGLAIALLGMASPACAQITITANYASNITTDPQAATIIATINAAIAQYTSQFTTFPGIGPQTIVVNFQEGGGLGSSATQYIGTSYSAYRSALIAQQAGADDIAAVASLPNQVNNPVENTTPNVALPRALARVLGFSVTAGTLAVPDGTITLNTSIMNLDRIPANQVAGKYDLQAVAQHEMDEVFFFGSSGIGGGFGGGFNVSAQDLFRYRGNGLRTLFTTSGAAMDYFSINSGATNLATYNNQTANGGGDWGDWDGASIRVQNAFGTPNAQPNMGVELRLGDIEGFTRISAIPEPTTCALLGLAAASGGLGYWRRRQNQMLKNAA